MQTPSVSSSDSVSDSVSNRTISQTDRWTDEELALGTWMREFPGQSLPGEPDIEIVRQCLSLASIDKLKWAMRELGIGRKAPGRSWAWFPVALASKLGVKKA